MKYYSILIFVLLLLFSLQKANAQQAAPETPPAPTAPIAPPSQSQNAQPAAPAATATEVESLPASNVNFNPVTTPTELLEDEESPNSNLNHEVIRRVVVFPFAAGNEYKKEAEQSWWKVREFLSEQQRFLVATKRFLQQNETYQARKDLKISDAVLLGKILESDCLITTYINNKKITMDAYSGEDGSLLWRQSLEISASRPIRTQLDDLSLTLVKDFLAQIPYQGFQIVDPLSKTALIEEGETVLARIDVGAKSSAVIGQKVQWIELGRVNPNPLFQGGGLIKIIAEGEVLKNENQVLTVEIKKVKDIKLLDKKSLVTIPDEQLRLKNLYAVKGPGVLQVNTRLLTEPLADAKEKGDESRPLLVALTSIANIVFAVLLAF